MMSANTIYYRIFGYIFTLLVHTINIAVMLSSFNGEVMKDPEIRHYQQMQLFFFTSWNMGFQLFYAAFSLYCDVQILRNASNDYKHPKLLENIRREFFNIVLWPSSSIVFTVFWAFWFYDRDLIYPVKFDIVISNLSNQIMHGFILPVVLWEIMFNYRPKPKAHTLRIISGLSVEVVYLITLFSVHKYYGAWIYPIFAKLNGTIFMPVFFIMITLIVIGFYHLQWHIYAALWVGRQKISNKRF